MPSPTGLGTPISRRSFLGSMAAAAALAAAGSRLSPGGKVFADAPTGSDVPREVWKAAYCTGCHQPTCAIRVRVVDGVAVEVEGDPRSRTNRGMLCPRGLSLPLNTYNPYRVKAPLKRTNPERTLEADPRWVEISWDEALDTVGSELKKIHETDPRQLIYQKGFGREEELLGFDKAFGTPNSFPKNGTLCPEHFAALHFTGTSLDRLDLERCNYVVLVGGTRGGGFVISDSSRHFVDAVRRGMRVVSVDPHYNNQARMGEWVPIRPGSEAAFGLALVYTIIHEIGRYDEWWLKVRSNAPYLIPDKTEYLNGTRVFMDDYVRDRATGKPLVWDEEKGEAVPFDAAEGQSYALTGRYSVGGQQVTTCFQALSDYIREFTPEWAERVTTIPAATIGNIAQNLVREARIGSTITIDGFEFPYRPACVDIRRAAAGHRMGTEAYKALMIVNVLLGCLDVPGGIGGSSVIKEPGGTTWYLQADEDGVQVPPSGGKSNQVVGGKFKFPPDLLLKEFYLQYQGTGQWAWKAVVHPEQYHVPYTPKAFLVHGGNPVSDGCHPRYVLEALAKIPFVASISYHVDEATQLADVVLPEDSPLEALSIYRMFRNEKEAIDATRGLYAHLVRVPVVERIFNTRHANTIYMELARRVGILPELNAAVNKSFLRGDRAGLQGEYALDPDTAYTWQEIVTRKIHNDFGPQTRLEEFQECAARYESLPTVKETYNYYYAPGNAVRMPIYLARMPRIWETLKANLDKAGVSIPHQDMEVVPKHYSAFPMWYDPIGLRQDDRYPYFAVQWKDHFTNQNTLDRVGNPVLQEIIDRCARDTRVVVVPTRVAQELGLREGDEVWVESEDGGKTRGPVHISELVHPECIGIPGNYGKLGHQLNPIANKGPNFNVLISPEERYCDPVEGSTEIATRVRIYRA